MIPEMAFLLGTLGYQVNKSMEIDAQATKKNLKAYTRTAEAKYKMELSQKRLLDAINVNAKRKNAILVYHMKKFQKEYEIFRNIQFKKDKGIEELEKIDELQKKIKVHIALPQITSGAVMTDSQLLITFALKGIGGLMIQDSEQTLMSAQQNLSRANVIVTEMNTICIALDGLTEHIEIVTELLENLGMIYMKSINSINEIISINGNDANNYSEKDIEKLNLGLLLTKVIYRIINTPLVNENGQIEQESKKIISEGQMLLKKIQ